MRKKERRGGRRKRRLDGFAVLRRRQRSQHRLVNALQLIDLIEEKRVVLIDELCDVEVLRQHLPLVRHELLIAVGFLLDILDG